MNNAITLKLHDLLVLCYDTLMITPVATISKKATLGDELVVLRRGDFEAFEQWQAEVQDALQKVKRGRQEYRRGKTVTALSPRVFR